MNNLIDPGQNTLMTYKLYSYNDYKHTVTYRNGLLQKISYKVGDRAHWESESDKNRRATQVRRRKRRTLIGQNPNQHTERNFTYPKVYLIHLLSSDINLFLFKYYGHWHSSCFESLGPKWCRRNGNDFKCFLMVATMFQRLHLGFETYGRYIRAGPPKYPIGNGLAAIKLWEPKFTVEAPQ